MHLQRGTRNWGESVRTGQPGLSGGVIFFDPSPTANLVGVKEGHPDIWRVLFLFVLVQARQSQENNTMETDLQYVATVVAEEKIRGSRREQIKLTRSIRVSDIINTLAKLFR